MDKKIFFGLVRMSGDSSSIGYFNSRVFELYLVNDTDNPITLKKQDYGGFKTYDDTVVSATPQEIETDIIIEPHSYIFYERLYEDDFDGAGQYKAFIEVEGNTKQLMFFTSKGVGFMGSLIPVMEQYGRIIHPHVKDL